MVGFNNIIVFNNNGKISIYLHLCLHSHFKRMNDQCLDSVKKKKRGKKNINHSVVSTKWHFWTKMNLAPKLISVVLAYSNMEMEKSGTCANSNHLRWTMKSMFLTIDTPFRFREASLG